MSGKMVQPLARAPGPPHDPFLAASAPKSAMRRRTERVAVLLMAIGLAAGVFEWLRSPAGAAWVFSDFLPFASLLSATALTGARWCAEVVGVVLVVVLTAWMFVRVIDVFTDDLAQKIGKAVAKELHHQD